MLLLLQGYVPRFATVSPLRHKIVHGAVEDQEDALLLAYFVTMLKGFEDE